MASIDDMGELNPQEQAFLNTRPQRLIKSEPTDDHGASLSPLDHLPPGNPQLELDTTVKAEERHDDREATMELQVASTTFQREAGNLHQDAAEPQEELSATTFEHTSRTESNPSTLTQVAQQERVDNLALDDTLSAQPLNTDDTIQVILPTSGADKRSGKDAQSTSIGTEMQVGALPVDASGLLRGVPSMLSGSRNASSQELQKKEANMGETQTVDGQEDAEMSEDMDPHTTDESEDEGETQSGGRQGSSSQADQGRCAERSREDTPDDGDNDDEDPMSVDDGSSEESGAEEDEDQDGGDDEAPHIAALQAKVAQAKLALQQHNERYEGGTGSQTRHGNTSRQPMTYDEQDDGIGLHAYPGLQYGQQQPSRAYDPRNFDPSYGSGYHGSMQAQQPYRHYQPPMHQDRSMGNSCLQGQMYLPPTTPIMPELYSSLGSGYQLHPVLGRTSYRNGHYLSQAYADPSLHGGYQHYPVSPYETQARSSTAPSSNLRSQIPQAIQGQRSTHSRKPQQAEVPEEAGSTDHDEPLRTRAPRHRSDHEDPDMGSSPPPPKSYKKGKKQDKGNNSEVEFVATKPSMGFKAPKSKKVTPKQPVAPEPPQTPNNPNVKQDPSSSLSQAPSSSLSPIDWKLPTYEATFEPPKTKDDIPLAKISIPGLVREELLLSPDHVEEETHLLLNVFLPAQQALATPDPSPAVAVLNFHTIAVMVIEAYIQFEIGDEWGEDRGHWHTKHDAGDEEYRRVRNGKDADPDEIFFAVIDRWRAGMESHKEPSKLVRGAQEFCDVALELVYYIKEHGLLGSERIREKQERDEERRKKAGIEGKTGGKRGAQKVVSEPKVRKKAKTAVAESTVAKTPVKKKARTGTVAVTVTKRK
jgi:hypothetical protein